MHQVQHRFRHVNIARPIDLGREPSQTFTSLRENLKGVL
jgi:hypothetical protein